ncbi:hypothetical protein [Actinomadura sp. NTSP31]|uniref:hypothetical protein n=1 Tax=Actinomadura sp. NTSP31 TaxID=1735447 RepID=UPI0035C23DE5
MSEQRPPALPHRNVWARIGPLHAALRRIAPVITAAKMLGEVPVSGPGPFVWVSFPQRGPYKIQWCGDGYQWTPRQWRGESLDPDPEVAARQVAERFGAPVHSPTPRRGGGGAGGIGIFDGLAAPTQNPAAQASRRAPGPRHQPQARRRCT